MATQLDPGKAGPHPGMLRRLVEWMNEVLPRTYPEAATVEWEEGHLRVVQQRTLMGLGYENLWGAPWPYDADVIKVDVSIGMVLAEAEGATPQLVVYLADRYPDRDWGLPRMSNILLDDRHLQKPRSEVVKLYRGLGIGWAVLDRSEDLGQLRMSLENGDVVESVVEDGAALMFMPFHSEDLWASTVKFEWLDGEGREIISEDYPLPPAYPHR